MVKRLLLGFVLVVSFLVLFTDSGMNLALSVVGSGLDKLLSTVGNIH